MFITLSLLDNLLSIYDLSKTCEKIIELTETIYENYKISDSYKLILKDILGELEIEDIKLVEFILIDSKLNDKSNFSVCLSLECFKIK